MANNSTWDYINIKTSISKDKNKNRVVVEHIYDDLCLSENGYLQTIKVDIEKNGIHEEARVTANIENRT